MKKLNPREVLILFLTLGIAIIFLTYQFVVKPVQEGAVNIDDQLRIDQGKLIKARHLVAQKSFVEARYQNLVNLIGFSDSDDAQMPTIISKIEAAARESNIHIGNIQPQRSDSQKQVKFLTVELEIDGQWLDILHFLSLLQQQPNFYFINELNLEKYSDAINSLRGRIVVSRMCLVNPS